MTIRLSTQHTIRHKHKSTMVFSALRPKMQLEEEIEQPEPAVLCLDEADLEPVTEDEALIGFAIGDFEIDAFLGEGSYARVWKGVHTETGVPVAIKLATEALDDEAKEDFEREVATLARLRHPNIVHVYDAGTISPQLAKSSAGILIADTPYIVMEFASRGTLENLRRPITWSDFLRMAVQLLQGLAHAHARGVLHRDIKAANVLLGSSRDLRSHIKLADFGIAFSLENSDERNDPSSEIETHILGTPLYMAPEQFVGTWRHYGPATDLYSFGIVAWELLTGEAPYTGNSVHELAMQHWNEPLPRFTPDLLVPEGTREWLEKLLAKNARDRFQFARHAAEALLQLGPPPGMSASDAPSVELSSLVGIATSAYLAEEPVPPALALSLLDVRPTPTLGRDGELTRLAEALVRMLDGTGRGIVAVRGASGVGVSHVGHRLVESLHEAGYAQTLALFCNDDSSLDDVMRDALRSVLRIDGLPVDRARERLLDLCGDVAEELDVFALVTWLEGAVDPEQSIFIDWFLRLSRRASLVLWIDNSGDGADVSRLLSTILQRATEEESRCLILHTDSSVQLVEPAVRARWKELGTYEVEVLRPLDPETISRVLDSTMPFSPDLRDHLVEMSMGMPGRALRAIRQWAQYERLANRGGRIHQRALR